MKIEPLVEERVGRYVNTADDSEHFEAPLAVEILASKINEIIEVITEEKTVINDFSFKSEEVDTLKYNFKFRGKDTKTKEWIYGYLSFIHICGTGENGNKSEKEKGFKYDDTAGIYSQEEDIDHVVSTKSIGQFSGLKDKDGADIYENDLLQCYTTNHRDIVYTHPHIVKLPEFYREIWSNFICEDGMRLPADVGGTCGDVKIVGNVDDNPELLQPKD